jgi:hypothetical protein
MPQLGGKAAVHVGSQQPTDKMDIDENEPKVFKSKNLDAERRRRKKVLNAQFALLATLPKFLIM